MVDINKFLTKPDNLVVKKEEGRFERFNLKENPFPANPFVNKDAVDKRINGNIFEMEIRRKEYTEFEQHFLKVPQNEPNHLRLGYLLDTSYVGRGNGKSAFLVNVQKRINQEFCLDISEGANKCFAVYVSPETGGRTKTFDKFLDVLFSAMLSANIIKNCLVVLRLESILKLKQQERLKLDKPGKWVEIPRDDAFDPSSAFADEDDMVDKLYSSKWLSEHQIEEHEIQDTILENQYIQVLPAEFPLPNRSLAYYPTISQDDFQTFYYNLKKSEEKRKFLFDDLINFFRAAGFNGVYILVDDFERIPEFQSARQKKDFAFELRSYLFDGLSTNAKIGFYNMLFVLHAGVPRLIEDAWSNSGMEHRAPISSPTTFRHIIRFEKLEKNHAVLLLKRYLSEFRIDLSASEELAPFTEPAVYKIAELSELNAANMLRMAYELLEKAANMSAQKIIDEHFVISFLQEQPLSDDNRPTIDILSAQTINLPEKAKG